MALVLCGFLLCSFFSGLAMGRDDPIEVLCLTPFHGISYHQQILRKEPMFDVTYIPTEGQLYQPVISRREVQRVIRRYFPRNYGDLTENYEFILMLTAGGARTDWEYFKDQQIEMMKKGIEEGGLGALRAQSSDLDWDPPHGRSEIWAGLSLSDAFPNDIDALLAVDHWRRGGSGRFVINDDPSLPPVLKPYRNLTMFMYYPYNTQMDVGLMIPRQGSQTYAWHVNDAFNEYAYPEPGWIPYVLGWRYGEGYTWNIAHFASGYFFASGEHPTRGTYLYGHDAFFGLIMYGAGRDPPLDVVLVHEIRERFGEFADAHSYLNSMIDFIEKFEVNINPWLLEADVLQDRWREGRRLYFAQEWEESLVIMDGLAEDMRLFTEETLDFKDRALLWVYITEWATVTGAFLASGLLLWTLMVKRKYYKEIDQTRLRPPPGDMGTELPEYSGKENPNPPWYRTGRHSRLAFC